MDGKQRCDGRLARGSGARAGGNPIYTAMVCFVAGIAVLLQSPLAVVALVLLTAGVEVQVRMTEEPFLTGKHGDRYLAWSSRTGRFLPHLGRLTPARQAGPMVGAIEGYRGSPETAPPATHREAPRSGQGGG